MSANETWKTPTRSKTIPETISRILRDGSSAVLATLVDAANASTNIGKKMLIDSGTPGTTVGSLGGEALDGVVIDHAARFLESKADTRVFKVKEFAPALAEWSEAQILFERIQPEPRLVICGAGHVGTSLARLASLIGYRATLIDDRAEFVKRDAFPPEAFPDERIELVKAESWSQAVQTAVGNGHGVCVAIVTRGHSEDEQCLRAAMTVNADYVGLIGSKRRTKIVLQRLRETGVNDELLATVHAPVGLDIGAVTPEEVALAIMAEIVAVRRGGKGGSLSKRGKEKGEEGSRGRG